MIIPDGTELSSLRLLRPASQPGSAHPLNLSKPHPTSAHPLNLRMRPLTTGTYENPPATRKLIPAIHPTNPRLAPLTKQPNQPINLTGVR